MSALFSLGFAFYSPLHFDPFASHDHDIFMNTLVLGFNSNQTIKLHTFSDVITLLTLLSGVGGSQ
jgi:hypothetical protein